jgi:hypothetical protein
VKLINEFEDDISNLEEVIQKGRLLVYDKFLDLLQKCDFLVLIRLQAGIINDIDHLKWKSTKNRSGSKREARARVERAATWL